MILLGFIGKNKQLRTVANQIHVPERFEKGQVINTLRLILERHYDPIVTPILVDNLKDASFSLQQTILSAMKNVQRTMLPAAFIQAMISLTQDTEQLIRKSARKTFRLGGIELLSHTEKIAHAKAIAMLLEDMESDVVAKGISILRRFYAEKINMPFLIPMLLNKIQTGSERIQINCLALLQRVLKRTPSKTVIEPLLKLVSEDNSKNLRKTVIRTLKVCKNRRVKRALINLSNDPDEEIQHVALSSLAQGHIPLIRFNRKKEFDVVGILVNRQIRAFEKAGKVYTPFQKWRAKWYVRLNFKWERLFGKK